MVSHESEQLEIDEVPERVLGHAYGIQGVVFLARRRGKRSSSRSLCLAHDMPKTALHQPAARRQPTPRPASFDISSDPGSDEGWLEHLEAHGDRFRPEDRVRACWKGIGQGDHWAPHFAQVSHTNLCRQAGRQHEGE